MYYMTLSTHAYFLIMCVFVWPCVRVCACVCAVCIDNCKFEILYQEGKQMQLAIRIFKHPCKVNVKYVTQNKYSGDFEFFLGDRIYYLS